MDKIYTHGDFRMPEAPPPYFPTVISQPITVQRPELYRGPFMQLPGLPSAGHSGHCGLPTVFPNTELTQLPHNPMENEFGNTIEQILGAHEKLSFHSIQTIGCGNDPMLVQIRGSQNQVIMSTWMTTVTPGHYEEDTDHHRSRTNVVFSDPTGRNLMKCTQADAEFTVTVGNRLLGVICGAPTGCSFCGSDVSVQSSSGDVLFKIIKRGPKITFVANGTTIATAKKGVLNIGDAFGVEFASNLASDTKAMILAVSYYLYVLYFAETACGCSGSVTMARWILLAPVFIVLIMIIGFVVVQIMTMKTSS